MEILVKKATTENLEDILKLNNQLFELEYNNFDSSLKVGYLLKKKVLYILATC